MTVVTKLIVGVHNTQSSLDLLVTGSPGTPAPDVIVTTRGGGSTPVSYNSGKGAWDLNLPSGDHVLRMDTDKDTWFDGDVTVTVVNRPETVFVIHTEATPPQHATVAWSGSVAIAGHDPKDPWPPPGMLMALDPDSKAYFDLVYRLWLANQIMPKAGDADADEAGAIRATAM